MISGKSTSEVSRVINEPSLSHSITDKENFVTHGSFSTSFIRRGKRASQLAIIEDDKFRVKCVEPELDIEKQLSVKSKRSRSNTSQSETRKASRTKSAATDYINSL